MAVGIAYCFALVASNRGAHWSRTPPQCLPVAEQLAELLKNLPPKVAESFASIQVPLQFGIGMYALIMPAIQYERYLAENATAVNSGTAGNANVAGNAGINAAAGSGGGVANVGTSVGSGGGASNGVRPAIGWDFQHDISPSGDQRN